MSSGSGDRRIVFVVGPGRSGTSTMAGALAHSGFVVPRAIKGNETNPQGFFEPHWMVNFHRNRLEQTGVRPLDTDPHALDVITELCADPAVRDKARTWLAKQLAEHERMVLKDPRLVWFAPMWLDLARELGVEPGFVIMLRHPSEVSNSRAEYYNANQSKGVLGWVNVALITERLTADSPRAFVHYPNLTTDWRPELMRLRDTLGLRLDPEPEVSPHPIDDFIDPRLRRMRPGWDDIAITAEAAALADRTFDALAEFADGTASADIEERLAAARAEYDGIFATALDLLRPYLRRRRKIVIANAKRDGRRELRAELRARAAAAPAPEPVSLPRRIVRKVRGS